MNTKPAHLYPADDHLAAELRQLHLEIAELRKLYLADRRAVLERLTRLAAGAKMATALLRRVL